MLCIGCFCRGPRFLLRQNVSAQPEKHFLYQQQQNFIQPADPYPNPPTISLLPLRPKTCMPRVPSRAPEAEPKQLQISSMFDELKTSFQVRNCEDIQHQTLHVGHTVRCQILSWYEVTMSKLV